MLAAAPLLRQPLLAAAGPTVATTNIVAANAGLVGLGVGLGLRQGSLYGPQPLLAGAYGAGGILKIH